MKRIRIALIGLISVIIFLILYVTINPKIVFGSRWKTQEIIYRQKTKKGHRIEYQMQGIGSFGYNIRIVEVKPFLFIDFAYDIDTARINKNEWQQVDEYINELGLKGA